MKNIDFLPETYKQRLRLQRARVWWGIVGTTFAGAIAASATAQWGLARTVEQQLRTVEMHAPAALEQEKIHAQLQGEVSRGGDLAALSVYLQHPWPRTQILSAVTVPLPTGVRLTDLRIRQESAGGVTDPAALRKQLHAPKPDDKTAAGPAADLTILRNVNDHLQTVVELTGETNDVDALHHYVALLGKCNLLASVRLKSLETGESAGAGMARFELRALVQAGYGIPGGPEGSESPPTVKGAPGANASGSQDASGAPPTVESEDITI